MTCVTIRAKVESIETKPEGQYIKLFTNSIKESDKFFVGRDRESWFEVQLGKPKKRSLNANGYLWILCQKIAEKLFSTKEEIYKNFIREVGIFIDVFVKKSEVESFKKSWKKNKLGWFCEEVGHQKNGTVLRCYQGSSSYDQKEMSVLLNEVVFQAKELGIETATPDELKRLKSLWKGGFND